MTAPPIYSFRTQLTKGEKAERRLDKHFSGFFRIDHASEREQRNGIDRWFEAFDAAHDPLGGQRFGVEYKTDWRASKSEMAFIETVSVERGGVVERRGWAYTSLATWLVYYVPGAETVYVLPMQALRANLPKWMAHHRTVGVQNEGGGNAYITRGLLVPLTQLERCAREVVSL
jgi:hypothetical protein